VTPADLLAHCRSMLAAYQVPKAFTFAPSLPRTPSGKVLRRELR
jgi:long-chain acyl-CoA synthetase